MPNLKNRSKRDRYASDPEYRAKVLAQCRVSYERNRERRLAKFKEAYRKNPEAYWENRIKNRFGITKEEYQHLYDQQNGACAICSRTQAGKRYRRLAVDHDHKTGKVRALLCTDCNRALGLMKDDINLMQKAISYLELHSKVP